MYLAAVLDVVAEADVDREAVTAVGKRIAVNNKTKGKMKNLPLMALLRLIMINHLIISKLSPWTLNVRVDLRFGKTFRDLFKSLRISKAVVL